MRRGVAATNGRGKTSEARTPMGEHTQDGHGGDARGVEGAGEPAGGATGAAEHGAWGDGLAAERALHVGHPHNRALAASHTAACGASARRPHCALSHVDCAAAITAWLAQAEVSIDKTKGT